MQFSRSIAYAVHATLLLARASPEVPIPCSELARTGNMPERFLLRILRNLVNSGILRSTLGVGGGYCLARPPTLITLREIVDAFDDSLTPSSPVFDVFSPPVRERVISTLQTGVRLRQQELEKLSIADLLIEDTLSGPHGSFNNAAPSDSSARGHGRGLRRRY